MSKRKFDSIENKQTFTELNSEYDIHPNQSLEKKTHFSKENKPGTKAVKYANCSDFPTVIWLHISTFLTVKDFSNISVNHKYLYLYLLWASQLFKKTNPDIYQSFKMTTDIPPMTLLRLFQDLRLEHVNYYTLWKNKSYIALFVAIKKYDVDSAQEFILHRLSKLDKSENVTDMVFYQKDGYGNSVITIAQRLGLQGFLDFCFNELILKSVNLIQTKDTTLISISNIDSKLQDLANSGMSVSLLWLYACAHVCEQKNFCLYISGHRHWDKTWISPEGESLLLCSTFLGSTRLAQYVMEGTSPSIQKNLLCKAPEYNMEGIYYNQDFFYSYPIRIAAVSKNVAMINYLMKFSSMWRKESSILDELLAFYVERRNLDGVRQCLSLSPNPRANSWLFSQHLGLSVDLGVLSPLSLAVAKKWQAGLDLFISKGADINGECEGEPAYHSVSVAVTLGNMEMARFLLEHGADPDGFSVNEYNCPAPIICAIRNGDLDFVKLLISFNASIVTLRSIGSNAYEFPLYEFPLVEAIYLGQEIIANHLLKNLKPIDALAQLENAGERLIKRSTDKSSKDHPFLSKIKTMQELLKSSSSSPGLFGTNTTTQPGLPIPKTDVNYRPNGGRR